MRKNNTAIIFGSLFFSCSVMAANGTLAPTVVPMVNGGQASIAISNTSPNLFTVPGDRIIAVNSLDGALTNNEQTASGGVVVATVNKKPFTFILETERGLNLSIQAVPREGAGRTIQLVSDLRGTGEEAGAWETSTPYESLLVTISQAVRGGKLPAGWYQVPVTKETLQAPAGLSSVADAVWTGNHLKMVRFAVENKTLSALNIRESDFWQPGTRAVMFSQPASQLLAGARMDVYVIRDGEGSINTIVKRKQYLWLGIVVVGTASAIGGALYLSDVDMSGNGETVAEQEPVPDMTGVVDTTFDDKVRQHATTEMQVTAAQMQKQYEEIRRELDVLNKQRGDDQRRIEKLGQDNAALAEQVKALGANPVTATGEPVPQMPASPPGPEGEPQPGNTPVSFPPQGSVAVPPPTAFYPGNGVTPPPQVTYQSVPVPNRIQRKVFTRNEGKQGPSLPYIPSGSFAKAMLIEGADANASVTGNESTVPMQLRITGLVEMPNSKTYDATGCFVGLEAWGDVSSERAIVRTRNISCLKDGKTIDMPIKGHVSFRGKNGIKGEVVMRNGKILGWAWGAGFVDGIGQGMERASQPAVGLGATAAYGAGDVLKMGIGGGASKAAQTLSDYYIKRAEQYHPVIPIGAGNEVTVVFQDGFQLKTVEEMALERTQSRAEEDNPESPVPVPPSAESHLNGFNTDQMLKQLGNLNPQQFMSGSQGGGNDGK